MYHNLAWNISLIFIAVILLIYVYVIRSARQTVDPDSFKQTSHRLRSGLFWGLIIIVTPVMVYTMTDLPYQAASKTAAQTVNVDVIGHQWYWKISSNQFTTHQPVVFHVTSADVNHGFGIYDETMRLIAQTQAMPGYSNTLLHTFDKAGTYKILCLEFCGTAHHNMITEIQVLDSVPASS